MFEPIFEEYRKAVDSALKLQHDMYREWMNNWPVKPQDVATDADPEAAQEQIQSYRRQWNQTLAETMEKHRRALNQQYKSGIAAIESAFQATEASTPEEFWRLAQEFWRKSIDSYKSAFEAQTRYLQELAQMWMDMTIRGKA